MILQVTTLQIAFDQLLHQSGVCDFVNYRDSLEYGSYLSKDYVICLVSGGKSGLDLYPFMYMYMYVQSFFWNMVLSFFILIDHTVSPVRTYCKYKLYSCFK